MRQNRWIRNQWNILDGFTQILEGKHMHHALPTIPLLISNIQRRSLEKNIILKAFLTSHIWCVFQTQPCATHYKASVTIVAGFCPEFHPPFLWCSKHQTRMTLNINNLVPSEFLNRSSRSVKSLISTLICI